MAIKILLVLFVQAFLFKNVLSQCIYSALPTYRLVYPTYNYNSRYLPYVRASPYSCRRASGCPGFKLNDLSANKGKGSFKVYSCSPVAPTGISIISQNVIKGMLTVSGEIPFLGAVSLDGSVPATGVGEVNYSCGDGCNVLSDSNDSISAFAGCLPTGASSSPVVLAAPLCFTPTISFVSLAQ